VLIIIMPALEVN